jgi:dinuclear metal center YbgI/SA1388 family protein
MNLGQLTSFLEEYFAASSFRDYGPNGLQVEGTEEIFRIACAVSASLNVIEQAIARGAQALIVHHGLFWNKNPVTLTGVLKRKIELLLKHNVSLLAYHLPMDAHLESGNNWPVALDLGWKECQPFGFFEGKYIGVKGVFEPVAFEAWLDSLRQYYGSPLRVAGYKPWISSAGLISGGAHKEFTAAIAQGLDAFITGSADESQWHEAKESGRVFVSVGHSLSEKVGPQKVTQLLNARGLDAFFVDEENPF